MLGRLSEEHTATFHEHYVWNPWTVAVARSPFGEPVSCNALLETGAIRRTGFYADVAKPQGIEDMLCITHPDLSQHGGIGGIGFGLSQRATERTAERLRRFGRLMPHLTRALDASLQLGRYADGSRQLARVLHLMPNPVLLIDGGMRVTYANPPAEALLRQNDGLTATRDGGLQLAAALPSETAALSRALAEALSVAAGTEDTLRGPLRLTRPSGRAPLLILPVPLPPPAFVLWELVEAARAMILVIDPEAQPLATAGAVRTAFGLTAAEARVAALIGGGLSGPQTAAALGISPETVKTHLARCFAKMGVHSQAGLVRVLAVLPVEASSLLGDNQKLQPAD